MKERSKLWPRTRKVYILKNKECFVCNGTKKLEVHHIKPYHIYPELELVDTNFITLCENDKGGINCHLAFGHLGSYKSYNVNVRKDAQNWNVKIKNRP